MVPAARLELARPFSRQILSLLCLPFHQAGIAQTLTFPVFQIKGGYSLMITVDRHPFKEMLQHYSASRKDIL